jgi:DNA-binding PucR family transcriptional regulator
MGEGQDAAGHPSRTRVSVQEAAEHLGTTVDAIRKRVQRDTIAHEKDAEGRVWILLDTDRTRHATAQDAAGQRQDSESGALISEMRGRIEDLREQLEAERQAHAEARRIIAGLVERMPQLEAPADTPQGPESAMEQQEGAEPRPDTSGRQEGTQKPWWQFWR